MSHLFCFNCGEKLEYNIAKPKFCSSCGESVGTTQARDKPSRTKVKPTERYEVDENGFIDYDELPNISKLEFDIEQFGEQMTLGKMLGQNTPPDYQGRKKCDINDFV